MKILKNLVCLLPLSLLAACASTPPPADTQVYWVSGSKAECSAGAGKMMCLRVSKHPDLQQAHWQYFYAPIEGFVFEEGVLKKSKCAPPHLPPKPYPPMPPPSAIP